MKSVRDDLPVVDPKVAHQPALTPGARAYCVHCDLMLVAKCGEINRWHWAHEAGAIDCIGSGIESAWHAAWKMWASTQGAQTEVKHGKHRADIVHADGTIIELQSSYLDAGKIIAREGQYGERLTWIYRITPGQFHRLTNSGGGWFTWRRPAPSLSVHRRRIIWHHGDRLYPIAEIDVSDGDFQIRFERGESDQYGPVLYRSDPAPFHVADPFTAINRFAA